MNLNTRVKVFSLININDVITINSEKNIKRSMNLNYRLDIDGLRGIAVIGVIFFHLLIPGFNGGFVGVDIFFVISGFLITKIILRDIDTGKFSIFFFYERRIRRIIPALIPVIIFCIIVSAFLFEASAFKYLGQTVASALLFSSNLLFTFKTGYFDFSSDQIPLLHTWSLAVEEQFYILFPIILLSVNYFFKKKYLLCFIFLGLLSFISSVLGSLHLHHPPFICYIQELGKYLLVVFLLLVYQKPIRALYLI